LGVQPVGSRPTQHTTLAPGTWTTRYPPHTVGLQLGDAVLVLVEQVLDLLLVHLRSKGLSDVNLQTQTQTQTRTHTPTYRHTHTDTICSSTHLNLDGVALFDLLQLAILVAQFRARGVELSLGDLPERVDLVSLQLHPSVRDSAIM
jgi:hypothetical protein